MSHPVQETTQQVSITRRPAKTGFGRPGALQMLIAVALGAMEGVIPFVMAASMPSHEWALVLNGFPAFLMMAAGMATAILYFVGFLRYCTSKGYSPWLGLLLLICNVPGFIMLLLLPQR